MIGSTNNTVETDNLLLDFTSHTKSLNFSVG